MHVCFYFRCSECVGVCDKFVAGDVCFNLGVLKYVVCLCRVVMNVVFSV